MYTKTPKITHPITNAMTKPVTATTIFALILLIILVTTAPSNAAISESISSNTELDNHAPVITLGRLNVPYFRHPGDTLSTQWQTSDDNPSQNPDDFTAVVRFPNGEAGFFSYYPDTENYSWIWEITEGNVGRGYLEVTAKDKFGNLQTAHTDSFFLLLPTTDIPQLSNQTTFVAPAPNPFNPSTTVQFSIPEDARVDLAVYDMRGRLVKTLVLGYRSAGVFTETWNGQNGSGLPAPAGLYLFRLQTHNSRGKLEFTSKATLLP